MTRPPAPPGRRPAPLLDDDTWLLPLPVPDAREGGESTWALWHEAEQQLDAAFAPTEPSAPAPLTQGPAQPAEEHRLTADVLMRFARLNNRVCPRPAAWRQLYQLLGGERYVDLQPPPVQPWLWTKLSHLQKRLRLRDQIEWAEGHGRLDAVARFLAELTEDDWVHMG